MRQNPREIARDLTEEITDSKRTVWRETAMEEWANEAFEITVASTVAHCVRARNKCIYEVGNEPFENGETRKTVTVDAAYLAAHAPTVADRLKRSGVRTGPSAERQLWPVASRLFLERTPGPVASAPREGAGPVRLVCPDSGLVVTLSCVPGGWS